MNQRQFQSMFAHCSRVLAENESVGWFWLIALPHRHCSRVVIYCHSFIWINSCLPHVVWRGQEFQETAAAELEANAPDDAAIAAAVDVVRAAAAAAAANTAALKRVVHIELFLPTQ